MPKIRTSRRFNNQSDLDVSKKGGKVITGLTGNVDLNDPPKTPPELQALKDVFDANIIKADKGGTLANAMKDASRAALLSAMNKDASYVDINCDEDMAILRSSGFDPVSTNRTQTVLEAPEIVAADYGQAGEIKLRVTGDPNRKAIQGRIKTLTGDYGPVIAFASTRRIVFDGLTAGTTYVMQLCGLGGSTGQSDWSEAVTKIAV